MRQTVFLLEDDPDISRLVEFHLSKSGYTVQSFSTGQALLATTQEQRPDLFLLDVMVPDGSGLDVCRKVRDNSETQATPVIFVTARASEGDRVRGFDLGADDYITKPFSTRELVARVRAVLRRTEKPAEPHQKVLAIDFIEIDSSAMQLRVRGELVPMTSTEFRLLEYLARHPGRMFSRDQLLDAVWGDARFVTPRSVDVYVRRIREKIGDDGDAPRFLKTMRGAGYRFDVPKDSATSSGSASEAAV